MVLLGFAGLLGVALVAAPASGASVPEDLGFSVATSTTSTTSTTLLGRATTTTVARSTTTTTTVARSTTTTSTTVAKATTTTVVKHPTTTTTIKKHPTTTTTTVVKHPTTTTTVKKHPTTTTTLWIAPTTVPIPTTATVVTVGVSTSTSAPKPAPTTTTTSQPKVVSGTATTGGPFATGHSSTGSFVGGAPASNLGASGPGSKPRAGGSKAAGTTRHDAADAGSDSGFAGLNSEPVEVATGHWGVSLHAATRLSVPIAFGGVVTVFVLLQALVDRRDPKLAHAPHSEDDDTVPFQWD